MASMTSGPHNSSSSSAALPVSHQVGVAILLSALLLGVPGNLLVVWSVWCRVRRRSVTCLLIANLAGADLLVLMTAPLFLRYLSGGGGWELGGAVCRGVHYLCGVNMYASVYLIGLMSLDRWLAVTRPFLSQRVRTRPRLVSALLGLWVAAFLMGLPTPFYRAVMPHPSGRVLLCVPHHWGSSGHVVFQYLWETVLGFLLPFSVVLACYVSVFCRLRSAMFQRRRRGNLLIVLILAAFALFWLPYHLVNLLQVAGVLRGSSPLLGAALAARPNVTAFAFVSSGVNPVLYVLAGRAHIRPLGLGFMARLFEATHSETPSSRSTRSSRGSNPEVKLRGGGEEEAEPRRGEAQALNTLL